MISGPPLSSELPRSASWIWFASFGCDPASARSNANSPAPSRPPHVADGQAVARCSFRACPGPAFPHSKANVSNYGQSRRRRGHSVSDAGVQCSATHHQPGLDQTMPENTHARSIVHCRPSGSPIELRARPSLPRVGPPEPPDEGRYTHIVSHDDRPLHRVTAVFEGGSFCFEMPSWATIADLACRLTDLGEQHAEALTTVMIAAKPNEERHATRDGQ